MLQSQVCMRVHNIIQYSIFAFRFGTSGGGRISCRHGRISIRLQQQENWPFPSYMDEKYGMAANPRLSSSAETH